MPARRTVLTGGGPLRGDIDCLLEQKMSLPVVVADDLLSRVARGSGGGLEMDDERSLDPFGSAGDALTLLLWKGRFRIYGVMSWLWQTVYIGA